MSDDESTQIEEILSAWYEWQSGYTVNLGAGRVDPACRNFDESDRYATIEERTHEAERKAQRKQAEIVDLCVDMLTWQQRASIQTHMKNKFCGVEVWSNMRLTLEEVHVLYQSAKETLLPSLRKRGMIKAEVVAWRAFSSGCA
jgi:hypothetical protein